MLACLSFRDQRLFELGLILLFGATLIALAMPVLTLFRLVPLTYNEGWNAFWADAALSRGALYGAHNPLIANNYPPLSFDLIGALGRVVGDNVIAGRLVSLASLLVASAAVYLWLRAAGTTRQIALAGAAFLLAGFAFFGSRYVAMDDPQMLAHAFMLAAIVVLWSCDFGATAIVLGAALMLMGGFTKHLLIPLPLAATLVIAIFRRERLVLWAACFAIGVPLGFFITSQLHGQQFLQDLLLPRAYSAGRALRATIHVCTRFLPLIALAAIPLVRRRRAGANAAVRTHEGFAMLYVLLSILIGGIASGGDGVTRNAFFDLLIATSLGAAVGLHSWQSGPDHRNTSRSTVAAGAIAFVGAAMAVYATVNLPADLIRVRELDALEKDTRSTVQMIARLGNGRAACETLSLCYWAHGAFTVDFFSYGQKLKTGALPVEDCTAALKRGAFPVVQLDPRESRFGYRLEACAPALGRFYQVAYRSRVGTLYVPRGTATEEAGPAALVANLDDPGS